MPSLRPELVDHQVDEVLLVRHAEAACNLDRRAASDTCEGLTDHGAYQARQLARRLLAEHDAGRPAAALYTSPVRRAHQTAGTVAQLLGIRAEVRHALRVPDFGPRGDGELWERLRQRWPADPDRPSRPAIDGGEPWRRYLDRAHECLAAIFRQHPGGRVIIVGHSETITAAMTLLTGTLDLRTLRVDARHTGITRFNSRPEVPGVTLVAPRWSLAAHNDTRHLVPAGPATDAGMTYLPWGCS
jgi:probable phosphoglycerate mutase